MIDIILDTLFAIFCNMLILVPIVLISYLCEDYQKVKEFKSTIRDHYDDIEEDEPDTSFTDKKFVRFEDDNIIEVFDYVIID